MASNSDIVQRLHLMAQLLELKGDNHFRIRAYERAVQTLGGVTQNISEMSEEELKQIPGIGSGMVANIKDIVQTGSTKGLEELKKIFPAGLLKLLNIQGLGPKRAKRLFEELHIASIESLKKAAKEGKLRTLEGFGEKIEQNILQGINLLEVSGKRMISWEARFIMKEMLEALKGSGKVQDLAPAGSLARGQETVGDLDILATGRNPGSAIEAFTKLPQVERIMAAGETKASVWLKSQIQCDFRVVGPESFGAALMYFTGSKEHNVAIRERALKLGYTINEYGLYKLTGRGVSSSTTRHPRPSTPLRINSGGGPGLDSRFRGNDRGKKIAGKTEKEVFKALGLEWIPPELRENRGEIEAAAQGKLPKLVEMKDIKGDFHNHTNLTDGSNTLEQMAEAAQKMGWEWVFIGDHSQSLKVAHGLSPKDLHETIRQVRGLNSRSKNFRIFRSMEVDILKNGDMDYSDEDLEAIDAVIAAVHTHFNIPEEEMTARIEKAASHPHVDILAHLSGRLLNRRPGYAVNVERVLERCQKTGAALEINGQPERQEISDTQARRAKELGIPLALTTDAHSTHQLSYMENAVTIARRAWLEKDDILNAKSAKEIESWLKNKPHPPKN